MKKRVNRINIAFQILRTRASIAEGLDSVEQVRCLLMSDYLKDCKPNTLKYIEGAYSSNNKNGALYCLEMAAKQEYLFSNIWSNQDFLSHQTAKEMYKSF